MGGIQVIACLITAWVQSDPPRLSTGRAMLIGLGMSLAIVLANLFGLWMTSFAEGIISLLVMPVLTLVGGPVATRYICRTLASSTVSI